MPLVLIIKGGAADIMLVSVQFPAGFPGLLYFQDRMVNGFLRKNLLKRLVTLICKMSQLDRSVVPNEKTGVNAALSDAEILHAYPPSAAAVSCLSGTLFLL